MLNLSSILKAQKTIKHQIRKTPLVHTKKLSKELGAEIFLKPEVFQKTGSFKIRGVLNKLSALSKKEKKKGIFTFSAGTHALSLAYATKNLKIPLLVVLPKITPKDKIEKIKKIGARVVVVENPFKKCEEIKKEEDFTFIHPFDDELIIAGHGTIGLEILEELPGVNIVFTPVGGGGLISGVVLAVKSQKPKIQIIGVEPEGSATMSKSLEGNKVIYLYNRHTIAGGLSSPMVGDLTLKIVKKHVDSVVLVSDDEILAAMKYIWDEHKIKTEPSAVVSVAAVMFKKIEIFPKFKVVCLVTGSNIDDIGFQKFINLG